jgi:hypothetical protein
MLEVMTTYIQYGPHYDRKGTKQCQSSPMSSISYAPRWVSNTLSEIWCSSTMAVCIDTSRHKWSFWTFHPWERPIDMLSKLSRSLNIRCDSLGLQTPHSRSREKAAPTRRTKTRARVDSLRKTIPNRKQRRAMGRQRKTLGNGVSSIRSPRITWLNASQSSQWWSR